jgi:hypothetical protein
MLGQKDFTPVRFPAQRNGAVVQALGDDPLEAVQTAEEALVADTRAGVSPAEFVERKLAGLLKDNPLPVSHAQVVSTGLTRGR